MKSQNKYRQSMLMAGTISVSWILLFSSCAQDVKQAVNLDAPKLSNSNNRSQNSQSNSGSGEQTNQNTASTNTGSGNQSTSSNSNSGSGNQSNTTVTGNNSGSGNQTINTSTGSGNQTINTNTGSGNQTINTNTGLGPQTNISNTGSGIQTNIAGNQTVNNHITLNPPANTEVVPKDPSNLAAGFEIRWLASAGAKKYTVYSGSTAIAETSGTTLNITNEQALPSLDLDKITVIASDGTHQSQPSATATATAEISLIETTFFNGQVYSDSGAPVSGALVRAQSLNSSVPYQATTSTSEGSYAFNNAPAGIQLEITVSRAGHTTRRRVEVLRSNKSGAPDANRFDFGTNGPSSSSFGVKYNALSDKPEVVSVTPGRNASGVSPNISFVLKFSEPMDSTSVENNFAIFAASTAALSIDPLTSGSSALTGLNTTFVGVGGTSANAGETAAETGATLIYDDSDFDISWNSDDTEVTFSFADESRLPSDMDSSKVPDYLVTLSGVADGQIKDKNGVARSTDYFKLTDNNFEMWYDFSIDTDEEEPQVISIEATDDEGAGDEIRVEFSEPMMLNTRAGQIMGQDSHSPLDTGNYMMAVSGLEPGPLESIANYGVSNIRFDSDDSTFSTVLIQFSDNTAFAAGDRVALEVASSLVDPAGNSVDSGNNSQDDTAN